jgi:Domain of unknown function (DUF4833)
MKAIYTCLLILFIFPLYSWGKELDLFFIQRSKNKNEVHYRLNVDENCKIVGNEPVTAIWKMLEEGPNETKSLSAFDRKAYSIEKQEVVGNWVQFNLKAIEERLIKATTTYDPKTNKCSPIVQVKINGKWSVLNYIYVASEEGFLVPQVTYIDIFGKSLDSIPERVAERIKP